MFKSIEFFSRRDLSGRTTYILIDSEFTKYIEFDNRPQMWEIVYAIINVYKDTTQNVAYNIALYYKYMLDGEALFYIDNDSKLLGAMYMKSYYQCVKNKYKNLFWARRKLWANKV